MDVLTRRKIFNFIQSSGSVAAAGTGTLAILGWIWGSVELNRLSESFVPMAMDTGFCFFTLGVALFLTNASNSTAVRRAIIGASALVLIYGLLKLLEYLLGTDLTHREDLFPHKEYLGTFVANRMSPITGGLLALAATAIGLGNLKPHRDFAHHLAGWIGVFLFSTGFLLTYGYISGDPFLYHGSVRPLSVLASFAFAALGASLVALESERTVIHAALIPSTKSRLLRYFLPLIVITSFAQQLLFQLTLSTDINRALVIIIVPLAASIAAVIAANKIAARLAAQFNQAEQQLAESNEKYRTVVEYSHDLYWTLDLTGAFVYANRRCTELSGKDMADWIGHNFAGMLLPEDVPRIQGVFLAILQGQPQEYEVRVPRDDGTMIYLEVTSVPEYHAGQIVGATSFGRDITLRKETEIALRNSEKLLLASQTVARLGSYDLDIGAGRWTSSSVLMELFGIDTDYDFTPEGWLKLVHPDWRDEMARYLYEEVFTLHRRFDKEYQIVRVSDGTARWVHGLGELTIDESGNAIRMIGTIQDITERKQLESERVGLEAQLRQAQKMETIGTLAGGVAHDFNNILTPILIYAEMAAHELGEQHPQREDLEHVISGAHRARDLVKQILTFSRQMQNERILIDPGPIAREAMSLLKASLPPSIVTESSIQTNGVKILADPSQVHQVLMNLCTNSYHAMRERGGTLRLELKPVEFLDEDAQDIQSPKPGTYLRLSVTDTGCGIDARILDRIFEPFFTTKSVGEGTGLGLSVVHGIIKSHDGFIKVASERGSGTTIDVYFPVAERATETVLLSDVHAAGGNERLAVVDNKREVGDALKDALEKRLGYRVQVFTQSAEVLNAFDAGELEIDLLAIDQGLPGTDGFELAALLRQRGYSGSIIMITGHHLSADDHQLREGRISGIVLKPPRLDELGQAIRKALDERMVAQ